MRNIYIVISVIFFCSASYGLESGVGINSKNEDELWDASIPYAIARQGLRSLSNGEYITAFQDFDTYVYGLTNSPRLIRVEKTGRVLTNNWPLTPWANRIKMQGEGVSWKVRPFLNAALGGGKAIDAPGTMAFDTDSIYKLDTWHDYLGCYSKTPLRYGDIDSDGTNELVLFLDDDLVVFSLSQQKTIFSTSLHYQDELAADQITVAYGEDHRDDLIYQYYAASGDDIHINAPFPATRSFAKVFIGDFNADKTPDIILWRKLYESRLKSENVPGFNRVSDLYVHYQLTNGEYLPQDTAPETIQNWLSTAQLTWSKGFPSLSECPGEEGKLIPEMHDPLLNDPDVLQ